MSREKFKHVQAGDPITVSRANLQGDMLNRLGQTSAGNNMVGRHSGSFLQLGTRPRWKQGVVTITDVLPISEDEEAESSSSPSSPGSETSDSSTFGAEAPIYKGVFRHYNFKEDQWRDQERKWLVDARGLDIDLEIGDRLVVYWDAQRGMLVPTGVDAGLRMVRVEKDGGVAGDVSTTCSWTYTVSDLSGNEMDTKISPEHTRMPNMKYFEAGAGGRSQFGLAQWVSGFLILVHLPGEKEDTNACEESS